MRPPLHVCDPKICHEGCDNTGRMPRSDGLVCASRSIGCHAYRSIDIKVTVRLSFRVSSIDISVVGTSTMLLEPVRLQKQAAMSRLASDRAVTHTPRLHAWNCAHLRGTSASTKEPKSDDKNSLHTCDSKYGPLRGHHAVVFTEAVFAHFIQDKSDPECCCRVGTS